LFGTLNATVNYLLVKKTIQIVTLHTPTGPVITSSSGIPPHQQTQFQPLAYHPPADNHRFQEWCYSDVGKSQQADAAVLAGIPRRSSILSLIRQARRLYLACLSVAQK